MKILLDTNVLVAAVLSGGYCNEMMEQAVHDHELYTTSFVLDEIKRVFKQKEFYPVARPVEGLLRFIDEFFILGRTAFEVEKVCRDPNDDQLLADAVFNRIDVLITGDKDLLILKKYKGVDIRSPRDYENL